MKEKSDPMPAKHILLMYITQLSGHHSAALAIEKALKMLQPEIKITNINAFNYTNPVSEKIINRLYMNVIKRTPQIWDYLYDNPDILKKIKKIKETVHKLNSPKLKNLFDKVCPTAVVCTQAFPCGMVADFKVTYNSNIPLIAALTDYVPHSYWIYDAVSYYISPSSEVTERLMKKGVPPNKIRTFGIPFDPKFNKNISKDDVLKESGLDPNVPTILIMGGGQGLGPIKTIIKSLEKLERRLQEIIVTGTNIKLYDSLKKQANNYKKKVLVFGYADNVNALMTVADIIITKPGGITTAEALAKNLPMIIINPLPGQEANNTAYLTEQKAAIKIDNPKDINKVISDLIQNPDKIQHLRESAASISKPRASLDIAEFLLNL